MGTHLATVVSIIQADSELKWKLAMLRIVGYSNRASLIIALNVFNPWFMRQGVKFKADSVQIIHESSDTNYYKLLTDITS